MGRQSRSDGLTQLGLAALGDVSDDCETRLVRALGVMIDAATAKVTKKAADAPKLEVSPRTIFDTVRRDCPDKVLCEPIDGRWFGRLGGVLKSLPFVPGDLPLLVDWLNAGGCRTWPTGVPTFSHLITHLDKWTAFAREWHNRGRNELRGKTSVGVATSAESTDLSAFSVRRLDLADAK